MTAGRLGARGPPGGGGGGGGGSGGGGGGSLYAQQPECGKADAVQPAAAEAAGQPDRARHAE